MAGARRARQWWHGERGLAAAALPIGAPQGPNMDQITRTHLNVPGRQTNPRFRGKTERAAYEPTRDQIRLRGFDSRRLHTIVASPRHFGRGDDRSRWWASQPKQAATRLRAHEREGDVEGEGARARGASLTEPTIRAPRRLAPDFDRSLRPARCPRAAVPSWVCLV